MQISNLIVNSVNSTSRLWRRPSGSTQLALGGAVMVFALAAASAWAEAPAGSSPAPMASQASAPGGSADGLPGGDTTFGADPDCWHCPRRPVYPIYVYPCPTPVPPPASGLPVPPGTTPRPTAVPLPSPTPGGVASTLSYDVCPQYAGEIPPAVLTNAVAAPWEIYGYGMLRNPNVPHHPLWNTYRKWLSVRNPSIPYSVCNPVVWKAGCP